MEKYKEFLKENKNENKKTIRVLIVSIYLIIGIASVTYGLYFKNVDNNSKPTIKNTYTYIERNTTKSPSSGSSSIRSGGCNYKYSDGSTCGSSTGSHSGLCDYHFNQLDTTYKELEAAWKDLQEQQKKYKK